MVFGGDMPDTDPEYSYIQNRRAANIVWVLDVDARRWDRFHQLAEKCIVLLKNTFLAAKMHAYWRYA